MYTLKKYYTTNYSIILLTCNRGPRYHHKHRVTKSENIFNQCDDLIFLGGGSNI